MKTLNLQRTVEPEALLTLDEIKAQVEVTSLKDDAYLTALEFAVRGHLEGPDGILGRALNTQTWTLTLDEFPVSEIRLPLPPIQSVSQIRYLNNADTPVYTVVSASNYQLKTHLDKTWVLPVTDQVWPSDVNLNAGSVEVTFIAGYGVANAVPAPIKAAAQLLLTWMYDNRASVLTENVTDNPVYDKLLGPYKVDRFGTWTA